MASTDRVAPSASSDHLDVLVVGAGLSGIAAGYHLQTACPNRTYAILEARDAIGGTWDLFRYPGIRSDSDMYTLGYSFAPWPGDKALADGPAILAYVRDTARRHGIDRRIRFGHRVVRADWSSADARWTVTCARPDGSEVALTASFVLMCSGYYRYDRGHDPSFPGRDRFRGRVVHPQHWPADLDYRDQRVVVIGSGATAVTLVPAMAATAGHVTMLQRSPTYIMSRPGIDRAAGALRKVLPETTAYAATRWKNVLLGKAFYEFCRRFPERARRFIVGEVRRELGADADLRHFTPRYAPWDQRLCLVPDSDLWKAIRSGKAEVVTDTIDHFTEDGLALASGRHLAADLVVTATGLELQFLGGMTVAVDGHAIDPATTWNYKGAMLSGVPNLAVALGYTNASWTLKAELACQFACRVLNHLAASGHKVATPVQADPTLGAEPLLDLSSGYVTRALPLMPRQGARPPWRLYQSYPRDLVSLRHGALDDGVLRFA
ncbi:MAG: NAD(P)/FAD-dependent oxidoreductase [Kofleriaceae bacterium]|nr:NAD(P)/FAD-dependent oxidoreductase [Kofleriaceae bacterium]MBP9171428.1 NAD(P)/FAD-dependent oxidoreductase [Kofleriaceae bacterium]MBP9861613.1 NAD(P)/FAD-dependent oxidoreductase [Kofleriaceae bacterium]